MAAAGYLSGGCQPLRCVAAPVGTTVSNEIDGEMKQNLCLRVDTSGCQPTTTIRELLLAAPGGGTMGLWLGYV